jgi:hypothetical protein
MSSDKLLQELRDEASRLEEDCNYSARGHYNAAAGWRICHKCLGVAATGFSALTAAAVLKEWSPISVAVCSVIAALLTAVLTFLKPSDESDRHHRAADQSLVIRNRARFFRNIEAASDEKRERELVETLKRLSEERNAILKSSPIIPKLAYRKAKKDIEKGKTTTHEVDLNNDKK